MEVYVEQPQSFEIFYFFNNVFKLKKILYSLKLTPKTLYDRLKSFLTNNAFNIDKINIAFFFLTKRKGKDMLMKLSLLRKLKMTRLLKFLMT